MDYIVKRPMLLAAFISSLAAALGFYSKNALFIIGVAIISFFFVALYKKLNGGLIVAIVMAFAVVISSFLQIAEINDVKYNDGTVCKGEFIVISEPVSKGDYYSTTLEVKKCDALKNGGKIDAIYYEDGISFADVIVADVSLKSMEESSYKISYYSEKTYLSGYIKNVEKINGKDVTLKYIASLRKYIKQRVFKNYEFSEAATILALITGDKGYFTNEFYNNVKAAGVAHVMVVSGMHLSIIVSFLLFFTKKLFYNRYFKALIIFIAVIVVAGVCGFTMSIIRAGITYILIVISLILNKPNTSSNTLGAAVTLILINNPLAVLNVVFQLTVLSTFGILVVALPCIEFIERKELIKNKVLFWVLSASLISISATVLTAPVVIYYFGYLSNVALITNLLICTPAEIALCLAILGLLIMPFERVFFFVSGIIIKYINAVINYFGTLEFSITVLPRWTAFLAVGIVIILLFGLLACKKRINMLKLEEIYNKKIKEGGKKVKWQLFTKKN